MSVPPTCPPPFAHLIARETLSDSEVIGLLEATVRRERATLAAMLGYLGLVVERRLYAPAGYDCVSAYLVDHFGWSLPSAQKRLQAAGLCRRFPQMLDRVAAGAFHLTGLCLLSPIVDEDNLERVCEEAQGLTRVHLSEYVRRLRAEREVELGIGRDVPSTHQMTLPLAAPPATQPTETIPQITASIGPIAPASVRSLEPSTWTSRLTVHATNALRAKLRKAQVLLSHAKSSRGVADVIDRALDLLIAAQLKRRYGSPKRTARTSAAPKVKSRASAKREHIAVETRHDVYVRDQGRCTFIGDDGHVCGSEYFIQLHHRIPWAKGGPNTPENLTLHCFTHNRLEAEREGLSGRRASGVQVLAPM